MLLAIDIGNTDVVFGVYEKEQWRHIWRTPTRSAEPAFRYISFLQLQFLEANLRFLNCEAVVISSVVPHLTSSIVDVISPIVSCEPIVVNADTYDKLKIVIDHPYELGSDLIANAAAAHYRYQQNCIIVDFGTALTFTTVSAAGEILGVAIVPGLKTAVKSLFANTAQLPEVPLVFPQSAIGKNTTHSIQAGVLIGYEGMIRMLIERTQAELSGPCVVVATGGLSSIITSLQDVFVEVDKTLTLDGLRIIGAHIMAKK